jgi:hypothetical protein
VNSSGAFRWLLPVASLLVLSVAWKIAIPTNDYNPTKTLIDFFERKNFAVTEQVVDGYSVVRAKAASCQLQATNVASEASARDEVQHLFAGMDRYFVVLRGHVYTHQPVLWTVISETSSVSLHKLGLISHVPPVIAVGASKSCDAEHLPWDELR